MDDASQNSSVRPGTSNGNVPLEASTAELLRALRSLLLVLERDTRVRWDRSLPFADYIVDRWQKAQQLGFGEGSSIYDAAVVIGDVKVGRHTWIGPFTVLDGSGGLEIGDYCSISAGVQIYTHDTVAWATSGGRAPSPRAAVRIGHRSYIGPHSTITKGVSIGTRCVIGAHSFVNIDIPDGVRAWGTPCRIIGPVDEAFSDSSHDDG